MDTFKQWWGKWKNARRMARWKKLVLASGIVIRQGPDRTELTRNGAVFGTITMADALRLAEGTWPSPGDVEQLTQIAVKRKFQALESMIIEELRVRPPKGFENEDWDAHISRLYA